LKSGVCAMQVERIPGGTVRRIEQKRGNHHNGDIRGRAVYSRICTNREPEEKKKGRKKKLGLGALKERTKHTESSPGALYSRFGALVEEGPKNWGKILN